MNFHATTAGTPTNGSRHSATDRRPATISAVSSIGSPAARLQQRVPQRVQEARAEDGERDAERELGCGHRRREPLGGGALRGFEHGDEMRQRRRRRARHLGEIVPEPHALTASAAYGRAMNAAASSAEYTPPCSARLRFESADSDAK